ncbi:MAG TPA: NAD(P)H-quinone oxidoreductase [Acidimicrobiales bacterium]
MRAVVLRRYGGPEVLTIEQLPDPVPGPEEVLVDVVVTALNRADLLQRRGLYSGPPMTHEIPGLEFAGVVGAVGERVREVAVGDAVMGIVGGGAYAEKLTVHERQVMRVPLIVELRDAAAIPEVFITAWDAMVLQGRLTSGRWALVHAGASGVGTAAIQIAKAIGARIAVTCSTGKADACRALGANVVLERSPHDWAGDAKAAVTGGFDVVLDVVGGDELNRNLDVAALRGTVVQVGLMGGAQTQINLGLVLSKRLHLVGTVLRARPLEEKIAVTQRFARDVLPLFESGALKPVIDRRFPLGDIGEAHEYLESNASIGKVLIDV